MTINPDFEKSQEHTLVARNLFCGLDERDVYLLQVCDSDGRHYFINREKHESIHFNLYRNKKDFCFVVEMIEQRFRNEIRLPKDHNIGAWDSNYALYEEATYELYFGLRFYDIVELLDFDTLHGRCVFPVFKCTSTTSQPNDDVFLHPRETEQGAAANP